MILAVYINQAVAHVGMVTTEGKISHEKKFDSRDWVASLGIPRHLLAELKRYLHQFPEIKQVGIGLPGILSADRKTLLHVPHIISLDNVSIADLLSDEFPTKNFKLARAGDCLALGEWVYGAYAFNDFLLINLDTYVESAAIGEGKLYNGFDGNGIQIASMLLNGEQTLEKALCWNSLEAYIYEQIDNEVNERSVLAGKGLSPESVCEAARKGDRVARSVVAHMGNILGNALASVIPLLDVSHILLTGRLAIATDLLLPSVTHQLKIHLASYYSQKVFIQRGVIGEKAGLLGAAALFR
ncbi:ROK family protein [Rhodocytophaga aerolata]|uniref:ROK family protein n=1 Tax=Rhodocytophaga aerolata TaxID=455078 RepID=A0ABT8R2U5_9BACT|nr:ROK family protein [Rhodocytophaga aerolata]MDO1446422.1 ROK family protein [Rhodocytophaga aerolata]